MRIVAGTDLRRGFPPDSGREPGFLRRKPEERAPGALPPGPPPFIARSLLARSFWCWRRSGAVVGLFRSPPTCPDLDSHFAGAGVGGERILLRGCTACEGFPLGGKLSPKVTDEGAILSQPFLVEGGTYRPDAFLLPPRWANRSPPHPPQCAHWGTFPPRGRLWGGRAQQGS